jgi:hypothetical protein
MKYSNRCDSDAALSLILDRYEENMRLYPDQVKKHLGHLILSCPKTDSLLLLAEVNILIEANKQ